MIVAVAKSLRRRIGVGVGAVAALALAVCHPPARAADDGGVRDAFVGPLASPVIEVSLDRRVGRAGRSNYVAPQQKPEALALAQPGPIAAPVALFGDDVLVGTTDRWLARVSSSQSASAPASARGLRWQKRLEDALFAPLVVQRGIVYAGADDDMLRAFALPEGEPAGAFRCGRCNPRRGVGPTASRCDVEGVTVASDGSVYVAADGVYALAPDLSLRWHYGPAQPTQSGNPVRPVHCLTTPVVTTDGYVVVGCDDDQLVAIGGDGKPRWTFAAGADVSAGTIIQTDGTIVFGTDEGKIFWLSPDGALLRTTQLKSGVRAAPALGDNGVVFFTTLDGALAALNPDGSLRWAFRTGARHVSAPLVDRQGTVVFGAADSRVYAVSKEGVLRWSVLLDGPIAATNTPLLGPDGTLWIGTVAGSLYAIR